MRGTIKRRIDFVQGQRAMAVAMIYPETEKAHRGKKSEQAKVLETKTFSSACLSQARTILHTSRPLAQAVTHAHAAPAIPIQHAKPLRLCTKLSPVVAARYRGERGFKVLFQQCQTMNRPAG